jgi:LEA14-like dessication related protein
MKNLSFVLLFLSSILLSSCFSYKEVELGDVQNVKLNQGKNGSADILVSLEITNPNGYKIKVKKIETDVFVNGQKIGKLSLNKKVCLPRKSKQVQEFSVNTQLSNLMAAVPSLLFGGDIKLQLKGYIRGKVWFLSKKFPIDEEKKINPKDLDLF